jgi:hypothetical protein
MATFNEIYHSYLKGVQGITPISGQQGITSLATPIAPNINSDNNINSTGTAPTSTTTSAPTTMNAPFTTAYSMTPMDTVLGMMSPVTGLGTLAAKGYGYPSLSYAIGALTGLGSMGLGGAGGASNSSGATDTGDTGSEAANDAATAAANASVGVGGGADSAGDGGDGYARGGRIGYAEGSSALSREEIINRILGDIKNTSFANENSRGNMYPDDFKTGLDLDYLKTLNPDDIKLRLDKTFLQGENFKNPDFTSGRIGGGNPFFRYDPQYMEKFNMQGSPLHLSEAGTGYNLRNQLGELESILGKEGIDPYMTKADDALMAFYKTNMSGDSDLQKRIFGDSIMANEQTTPTKDFSDYLDTTPEETGIIEQLYPRGDFLNIKETATSPTDYNIRATEDLVKNLPSFLQPIAPAAAGVLSLPYDAIQAYQRMEPGSGIQGFGKAYQAERPLQSAFERFVGASGPLANNINTAVGGLNSSQKQQYMNYAVQNPDKAIAAAQQNKDFMAATQRNTTPPAMANGGRVSYLQGGLVSLLGDYYGKR